MLLNIWRNTVWLLVAAAARGYYWADYKLEEYWWRMLQ
jgi:hypothetical protein